MYIGEIDIRLGLLTNSIDGHNIELERALEQVSLEPENQAEIGHFQRTTF